MGFRRLANIEFKLDARDGKYKLIECNARFTAANCLLASSGIDAASFVYRRAAGLPQTTPLTTYRSGLRLWDPFVDLLSFLELRRCGQLTFRGWVGSLLHRQTFPYFRWLDPLPALARCRKLLGMARAAPSGRSCGGDGGDLPEPLVGDVGSGDIGHGARHRLRAEVRNLSMKDHRENHQFLRHAAIYLLARAPGIIAFLAIPLFTRLLDPAGYGKYAMAIAMVNLLSAFVFQGLQLALLRYLPAYKHSPERLKSTLLTLALLLIAATGVCAAVACMVPMWKAWRSLIAACWLVVSVQEPFDLFSEYARAQLRRRRFMLLTLAKSSIATLLGVASIAAGAGWWGALAGAGIGMLIPNLYSYWKDWAGVRLGN